MTSSGEDLGEGGALSTAGGSVNGGSHCGHQHGGFSKKLEMTIKN